MVKIPRTRFFSLLFTVTITGGANRPKLQNVLASIVAYQRKKYNFINYSHTYCFAYPHFKKPATQVCLEAGCTEIPGRGHTTKARARRGEVFGWRRKNCAVLRAT